MVDFPALHGKNDSFNLKTVYLSSLSAGVQKTDECVCHSPSEYGVSSPFVLACDFNYQRGIIH